MGTAVRKIQEPAVNATRVIVMKFYTRNGPPMVVHLRPKTDMTEAEFFRFCQINRDLRVERTAAGELIIMPPTGGETSSGNAAITARLYLWAERDGTGVVFDSSGGFRLPNSAVRSPDASWVLKSRLAEIPRAKRKKFPPLCPDFIIELRSETDGLAQVQAKMREYKENGARLGFLIDPKTRRVHVYRPGRRAEILHDPKTVSGEPVLPGFALDLGEIW
jgi:Uma2 family endonuclease